MLDPLYSLRPKRDRHSFWARDRETDEGLITVMRNDLPGIAAHTAARGPKRPRDVVKSTGLELRKRILWRGPPALRRASARNTLPLNTASWPHFIRGPLLLDLDLGAGVFELLLDGRGLVLVHAFLDGLGCAINEVLGFFQAQARDFANRLDDVDLVAANVGEHDGEFRLLFRRCRAACCRAAARRHYRGSRRGNAEGFFHFFHQVRRFEQRQALDFFQDRFDLTLSSPLNSRN